MSAFTRTLAAAVILGVALPAAAQETAQPEAPATEAPAAEAPPADPTLSLGEPVGGANEPYVAETHGDWELRCIKTDAEQDPCQLYQLLKDDQGNSVAEITVVSLPDGQEAIAGATIITPLETLLTAQLTLAVDGAQPKRYPFTFCARIGCIARVGFTQADIDSLQKGASAKMSIVPVAAPDRTVDLKVSLKGFTAGFEAVKKVTAAE